MKPGDQEWESFGECQARHPVFDLPCHRWHHPGGEHAVWQRDPQRHTLQVWHDDWVPPPPFGTTGPMPARRAPREIEA